MLLRTKLILGFTAILLILGISTFVSRSGMNEMAAGAKQVTLLSDATADTLDADISLLRYIIQGSPQELTELQKHLQSSRKAVAETIAHASNPEIRNVLTEILQKQDGLPKLIDNLSDAMVQLAGRLQTMEDSFESSMEHLERIVKANDELQRIDFSLARLEGGVALAEAKDALTNMHNHVSFYRMTFDEGQREQAVRAGEEGIVALQNAMRILEGTKAYASIQQAELNTHAYLEHFARVTESLQSRKQAEQTIRGEMVKILGLMKGAIATSEELFTAAQNSSTSKNLGIGVGALVIGAIITVLLIKTITSPINAALNFAERMAKGDLSGTLDTKRSDEFGQLARALQVIKDSLHNIVTEYHRLQDCVINGDLSAKGDVAKFNGEFAALVQGTNAILHRFGMVLDSLPSPVVVLDRDLKATYLNQVAQNLAGSDYHGKTCKQLFERDDFGSDSCGLCNAVQNGKSSSAETVAHPKGKRLDVSYTAIPMFDAKNQMSCVLQLIVDITTIKEAQRTMQNVAQNAMNMAERVAAASEQLSSQIEEVSRGTEIQRNRVESNSIAINEMAITMVEVAQSAAKASTQSEVTLKKAGEGAELVNQVVKAINGVNAVAINLQENMHDLGHQAESIGGVMNVISDIADQTNLLALNAAIEAARAGEAGRGFAVVADEVRKLAEKTMSATHEVGGSIQAIQTSARTNINEVTDAVNNISQATSLANASGQALHEIVDLASSNSTLVTSIAAAAEKQSATSDQINESLGAINHIVIETSEGMVQASNSVQDLAITAQELKSAMEQLR